MFSKRIRGKLNGKTLPVWLLVSLLIPVVALIMGTAVPVVWAEDDDDGPITLDEAKIIFETNFTDGDTGIQVFLDGEPWRKIKVKNPKGEMIFDVMGKGSLKNFGLTELFFESNEPNFEDMSLLEILALFPEGYYKFKGKTVEEDILKAKAWLSHDLPCAPDNLSPAEETVDIFAGDVVISWDHVTKELNDTGNDCSDEPITVETYQVIVENIDTEKEFSIFLEAEDSGNQVTVPDEFIEDGATYKWEVLAIAENGNQTIAETWFCAGDDDEALCPEPED